MKKVLLLLAFLLLFLHPSYCISFRIALSDFAVHSKNPNYEFMGKGISEMIAVELAKATGVNLIERERRAEVLEEIEFALSDLPRSGKPPRIDADDKTWVVHIAYTKPKEIGYPHELWTYDLLAKHIRKTAASAGHPSLSKAGKSLIYTILKEHDIRPHKITYYLEQKDPEFEEKMAQVLCVYKEVQAVNEHDEIDNVF